MPGSRITPESLRHCVILAIDDEDANVRLLSRILSRAGFAHVHTTTDAREGLALQERLAPDLILLDLHMPGLDGFGVLDVLRERVPADEFLPVLAITGDDAMETRQRVLSAGAKDFLGKPFQPSEVVVRVENLLTTRMLHRSLRAQNERLEEEVRERTAELELALGAAQRASLAKSRFLATMSHELRTPLNSVIGFSQQLLRNKAGNLRESDLAFLERIRDNGARLLAIITDILDLSRIETGSMPVEASTVDLRALLLGIVERAAPAVAGTIETRTVLPERAEPLVTDEEKLSRVVRHLVDNATKFTRSGRVTVVLVTGARGEARRIDVVDTGVGIPCERLRDVFRPFEQADNTLRREFGGTGLGLALSRTLCDLLGYRLEAVSEPGTGSVFSVLLRPDAVPPASYAEAAVHAGGAGAR